MLDLSVNLVPVLVGGALYFAVGSVWYATKVFGKRWMSEVGMTEELRKDANMSIVFGGALVMMILQSLMVAVIINSLGMSGWAEGAAAGLLLAGLTAVPTMAINYLYQLRTTALFAIDASYIVVGHLIVGILLGIWQ